VNALGRVFLLVQQVQLVLPDGFQVQVFRAGVIKLGELGHIMEVAPLGAGREAAPLHVCDEALRKRCQVLFGIGIVVSGETNSNVAKKGLAFHLEGPGGWTAAMTPYRASG